MLSVASIWKPPSALKEQQRKGDDQASPEVQQLDFEFVLFASAVIDYDYIMALIARYSAQAPGKQKMSREQLIGLIQSDAKFMDERDDIAAYINTLKAGEGLSERHSRRLPAFQGGEECPGTRRHRWETRAGDRRAARLCGRHPATHDLRRGAVNRPDGTARAELENAPGQGTRPHGRPGSRAQQTRPRTRNLQAECV